MNQEAWQRVQEIFHAALHYERAERSAFLMNECAGDNSLLVEVESLLEAHERSGSFMNASESLVSTQLANSHLLHAGRTFGHYQIISEIGAGGMGQIFLAQHTKLNCKVALKVLPANVAGDADRLGRFVREAQAAASLNHPSIAHIKEIDELEGIHFIAMEYVDGVTFRKLLDSKTTPLKKLFEYFIQVAEGLAKAHELGIVHRDLKPDNIMISHDSFAKIPDFGLAKLDRKSVV